jgi:hypothetical protein
MNLPICYVVICQLLAGGGPKQCDQEIPFERHDLESVTTWQDCRTAFHSLRFVLPTGLRLVSFDFTYAAPQVAKKERE